MDTSADAPGDAGVGTGDGLGAPGGDVGGTNGGNDGLSFGTSGPGDTDYSGASTDTGGLGDDTGAGATSDGGILGAIYDALFGGPRTGDPVADIAITGWLSTIPFAGPMLALSNAARDRGYSVEAADLPSSPSAGYDGYQTYSPYRPSTTNPFANLAAPQADASWLPQGGANLTPYMLPQGAQAAQAAGSGANATVDPYKAPEKPSWPLLLVAAGVLAGLTL